MSLLRKRTLVPGWVYTLSNSLKEKKSKDIILKNPSTIPTLKGYKIRVYDPAIERKDQQWVAFTVDPIKYILSPESS